MKCAVMVALAVAGGWPWIKRIQNYLLIVGVPGAFGALLGVIGWLIFGLFYGVVIGLVAWALTQASFAAWMVRKSAAEAKPHTLSDTNSPAPEGPSSRSPAVQETEPKNDNLRNSLMQSSLEDVEARSWPLDDDEDLAASPLVGKSFYLSDLARQAGRMIHGGNTVEGRTYEDCLIHGPVVVKPLIGTEFVDCRFSEVNLPDSRLVWPLTPDYEGFVGTINLKKCVFLNCSFLRVGILTEMRAS